jgi:hypothetical protein
MTSDPRIHVGRRSRAIDRLRTMTTGAAVAGVAGTAAFGILAAATWSGEPGATGAAAAANPTPTATAPDDASGRGSSGEALPGGQTQPAAPGGGSTRIRPTQPGSGRSHATTGGSS